MTQYVPVKDKNGEPLMPCHPARARKLQKAGRAEGKWDHDVFYIQMLDRTQEESELQDVAMGIDPGSKKEGITVKSAAHTYLNVQAGAVTWVGKHVEQRRIMRRLRRKRKTPYRANKKNRARGGIPPSTKARWDWKLRLAKWLSSLYPISQFVVEDIAATTRKGKRRWNASFSPLEVGKRWFYGELEKIAPIATRKGYETKELRDSLGLKKSGSKLSDKWEAHCVDSWVLANWWVGGHTEPDNKQMLYVVPLRFHRRQLHRLQPSKGGIRRPYGGTRSMGFKRGSWVKHPKWGKTYVGGSSRNRISLHDLETGRRLTQHAKAEDCKFLCYSSFRVYKRG